jgi:hypothetical protein
MHPRESEKDMSINMVMFEFWGVRHFSQAESGTDRLSEIERLPNAT